MKNQKATEFLTVFDAGQWRRSGQEVAKMSITLINGKYYVTIRAFVVDAVTGKPVTGKQGITFPLHELPELLAAARRALRCARNKGWVPEEEEQ